MVGTIVKVKIGELEEEVRAGFLKMVGKYLTGVVQIISSNNRFLVSF